MPIKIILFLIKFYSPTDETKVVSIQSATICSSSLETEVSCNETIFSPHTALTGVKICCGGIFIVILIINYNYNCRIRSSKIS